MRWAGRADGSDPLQPLDLADHSFMLKTYRISLAQLSRNDQVRHAIVGDALRVLRSLAALRLEDIL